MVRRVLVVDDDPGVRGVLKDYLSHEGWEVEAAETGAKGLALARTGRYQLVLLDRKLPDGDGARFCRELKSMPGGERVVIILMSGHRTRTGDMVSGLDCGALDYVAKPLALDELSARLRAVARVMEEAR